MSLTFKLTDEQAQRHAAYMRIARDYLQKRAKGSVRIEQLGDDLDAFMDALHQARLASGWHPYPEEEPVAPGDKAYWVELDTGETFLDHYDNGDWRTQRRRDVKAWCDPSAVNP